MILFVYGSLRKGQYNHVRYSIDMRRAVPRGLGKTQSKFTMVDFGQYPGLYADGDTPVQVVGELYEIPDGHAMLAQIDDMERSAGYTRVEIILVDGRMVNAYVQLGRIESYHTKRVPGGDWSAHHVPTEGEVRHMASQEEWMIKFAHEEALEMVKRSKPKRSKCKSS